MELYSDKMQFLWNYIPIKCRVWSTYPCQKSKGHKCGTPYPIIYGLYDLFHKICCFEGSKIGNYKTIKTAKTQ